MTNDGRDSILSKSINFDAQGTDMVDLDNLQEGMPPGITRRFGASLAEAATVCLEQENHRTGVQMALNGDVEHTVRVLWRGAHDDASRFGTWNDPDEATEYGAIGIAFLLVSGLTEYTVVERARKGSGFDYWLGRKGSPPSLFQERARLEVSGIRRGDEHAIASRVRSKSRQVQRSESRLPGVIAVVEFGAPRSWIQTA